MARPRFVIDEQTAAEMRRLRDEEHRSQDEIAEALGISRWLVRTRLGESGSTPHQVDGQAQLLQAGTPTASRSRAYAGCGCERAGGQGCVFA